MKKKLGAKDLEHCAHDAANYLKGLANSHRLIILCALMEEECCVNELLELLPLSQPLLSQHLGKLKKEGIVDVRREAQRMYYRVCDPGVAQVLKVLKKKFAG